MALLDFREIPEADKATGRQDAFELFAREALHTLGFEILQHPSRGADGGKDLIAEEVRIGLLACTRVKWLVSCKHFVFSGKSVTPNDEKNVRERVEAAGCHGFLGFYSTLPSTGLSNMLSGNTSIQVRFLDHEQIERYLLESDKGRALVQRYFPRSLKVDDAAPAQLYSGVLPIVCEHCGKDLLDPPSGIWVLWHKVPKNDSHNAPDHYVDFHLACKGLCDRIVERSVRARHAGEGFIYDGWDDVPDLLIPTVFITKMMALMNGLVSGNTYEEKAFGKVKRLLLATFPYVARTLTAKQQEELKRLRGIPSYLGGMGYDSD